MTTRLTWVNTTADANRLRIAVPCFEYRAMMAQNGMIHTRYCDDSTLFTSMNAMTTANTQAMSLPSP